MTAEQKEELRRGLRGWLADRCALAFNASSIHRGISREVRCTVPEVEESLFLLRGLRQVTATPSQLGSTLYYQITAEGTLAHERGE